MINLSVLAGLFFSTNTLSALIIDGKRSLDWFLSSYYTNAIPRASLPVYNDNPYAQKMFFESGESGKFVYRSYVGWSREQYSGNTITINEEGDRIHSQTTLTPLATIRLFGGSALWGTGADNQGTIPALLNATLSDYTVLNHGESGFVSRQGLARLINLANNKRSLDLVIFYDGANDVNTLCSGELYMNRHGEEERITRTMENKDRKSFLSNLEHSRLAQIFIASSSFLMSKIYDRLIPNSETIYSTQTQQNVIPRCRDSAERAESVASILFENWRIARDIVRARGGSFLAVLQPVAYIGTPKTDYLDDSLYKPERAQDFEKVYPLIKKKIEKERINWILDLTDSFDVSEAVYIDSVHVTRRANEIVASRIKEAIDRLRLLPTQMPY